MAFETIKAIEKGSAFKDVILDPKNFNAIASVLNGIRLSGANGIQCRKTGDGWSVGFALTGSQASIYQAGGDSYPTEDDLSNAIDDGDYIVYPATLCSVPPKSIQQESGTQDPDFPTQNTTGFVLNFGNGYIEEGDYILVWRIEGYLYTDYEDYLAVATQVVQQQANMTTALLSALGVTNGN